MWFCFLFLVTFCSSHLFTSAHRGGGTRRSQPDTDGRKTKNIFPLLNVTFRSKKTVFRPKKDVVFIFFFWLYFGLFYLCSFLKNDFDFFFFPGVGEQYVYL